MVGCEEADLSDPDVIEDNTADTVEWSKLQDRGGVIYLPNTDKPFSGFAKRVYENEQVEILAQFKDGYVARLKQWQKNGTPRWDVGYREGKVAKSDVPLEDLTFLTNIWFYYGLSTIWYKNGQKVQGTFNKDGELDGILTWWYENGQKNSEANYKDGRPDGLSNVWYEDGQKESELNWKDGWKEGLSTYWYKNGQNLCRSFGSPMVKNVLLPIYKVGMGFEFGMMMKGMNANAIFTKMVCDTIQSENKFDHLFSILGSIRQTYPTRGIRWSGRDGCGGS